LGLDLITEQFRTLPDTKAHNVLTFRGTIEGNSMSGLYGLHGKHAEWRAIREN
jgi:hypothetical protein